MNWVKISGAIMMETIKKHLLSLVDTNQINNTIKGWQSVNLLAELDIKTTKKKVDELLSQYRTFVRLADEEFEPKVTTTYSLEPKSLTNQIHRPIENAVVFKVTAQEEILKINKAINKLNAYDRQRLYDKYLCKRQYPDKILIAKYIESESGYYKLLERAQLRFAESYENGRLLKFL
ncbi:ArpU family transcriptional regulator [Ligilactobacillus sp. WILCCON 0076]|uniref:ArpU family transcriptional regulator n=1 Tax=Ligilactobacillus ubinensis TaxID=2876789 RepID=A0A9X2FGC1_9LACO|nr:ArpU family phage packaging/lysis transcriptional regulator [Ligilactobacillus ubinensis]MCP0885904.1 ArpU family transcriptional regulator [Ligilactobacillus ubinensis]